MAAGVLSSALLATRCVQQVQEVAALPALAISLGVLFCDLFLLRGATSLARAWGSLEFWRTGIGMCGSSWLWLLGADLTRAAEDGAQGIILVLMGSGVGTLLLLDHLAPEGLRRACTDDLRKLQFSMLNRKAGILVGGLIWMRLGLSPGPGISLLVVVFLVVFTVWLGLAEIALRKKLGGIAVLFGLATALLGVVYCFDAVSVFRQGAELREADFARWLEENLIVTEVPTLSLSCAIASRLFLSALLLRALGVSRPAEGSPFAEDLDSGISR